MTYDLSTTYPLDIPATAEPSGFMPVDTWAQPRDTARDQDPVFAGQERTKQACVLIVDDERVNVDIVRKYLQGAGYANLHGVTKPGEVLPTIARIRPELVLMDVMMPGISGLEILAQMRADPHWKRIPVIVLTGVCDTSTKKRVFQLGANDLLAKPLDSTELTLRVGNALTLKFQYDQLANYSEQLELQVRSRTAELVASRRQLLQTLARASEFRDTETAHHVMRVGRYVGMIARELGCSVEVAELLQEAAPLHDVGKIGIPDSILLKPGKLDANEYERMKLHCQFGGQIIQPSPEPSTSIDLPRSHLASIKAGNAHMWLIPVAATIALTHHEHWDGTGYPLGLKGTQIPLEGRITAVADVFDALNSRRPYKESYSYDQCMEIMEEGRERHFDPTVLDAFWRRQDDIFQIQTELAD